jgi:hypothetical protein
VFHHCLPPHLNVGGFLSEPPPLLAKHYVFSAALHGSLVRPLKEGALPFLKTSPLIREPSPFLTQDLPHLAAGCVRLLTHQSHLVDRGGAPTTLSCGLCEPHHCRLARVNLRALCRGFLPLGADRIAVLPAGSSSSSIRACGNGVLPRGLLL